MKDLEYFAESAIKRMRNTTPMPPTNKNDFVTKNANINKQKETKRIEVSKNYGKLIQYIDGLSKNKNQKHENEANPSFFSKNRNLPGKISKKTPKNNEEIIKQPNVIVVDKYNENSKEKPVDIQLINRLKSENCLNSISKYNKPLHDPETCPSCLKKQSEIMQHDFIRDKKNRLENRLVNIKIDDLIYKQDTVLIIGDIAANLPRHSDDPNKVWKRMIEKSSLFS